MFTIWTGYVFRKLRPSIHRLKVGKRYNVGCINRVAVPRSCPGKATVVIGEASTSTLLPAPCAGLISLPAPTDRTCGIAKVARLSSTIRDPTLLSMIPCYTTSLTN